ncbi:hypothetical protein AB5N19_07085 [Seiridium cardinale]
MSRRYWGFDLLSDTGGSLAEEINDAADGNDTAAGGLADGGAHGLELSGIRQCVGWVLAVDVGQSGYISRATLGCAVESRAGSVGLTLHEGRGRHGGGEECGESEKLHFDGVLLVVV